MFAGFGRVAQGFKGDWGVPQQAYLASLFGYQI